MYKNLNKEMDLKHISIVEIADGLGFSYDAVFDMLSVKNKLSLENACYIRKVFFSESALSYLFEELTQK